MILKIVQRGTLPVSQIERGKIIDAITSLKKVIDLDSSNAGAYYELVHVYENQGDKTAAEENNPDEAIYYYNQTLPFNSGACNLI